MAIKNEIELLNNVSVDKVVTLCNLKTPVMKIMLATIGEAEKLLDKGVRGFPLIIPKYNVENERYRPVLQCLSSHKPTQFVLCAKKGHIHKTCLPQTLNNLKVYEPHS